MAYDGGGCEINKAALVGLLSLFVVAMVNGVNGAEEHSESSSAIKTLCEPTDYRQTCEEALAKSKTDSEDPRELIKAGFHYVVEQIKSAIKNSTTLKETANDPMAKKALDDCSELMDYAIDDLLLSFDKITETFDFSKMDDYIEDLRIWLSGALTYQVTCLDGFENVTGDTVKR
ncbi:putative pectinesterase/pectinesterase inhibitor 28, partial [Cucurbita argyrosperma subsp. sororia]